MQVVLYIGPDIETALTLPGTCCPINCILLQRGLSPGLARQVAEELTAKDVVRAHARDELGIDLDELANPIQVQLTGADLGHLSHAVAGSVA